MISILLEVKSQNSFKIKAASRPQKRARRRNNTFVLHLPKRGHNKTDSIVPFVEGFVVTRPRRAARIMPASPPLEGATPANPAESCAYSNRKKALETLPCKKICRALCLFIANKHKTLQKILHSLVPHDPRQKNGQRCPTLKGTTLACTNVVP